MPLLEIKDLKIRFANGTTAVDGVSFDIGPNEIVGLVGESGSGKTVTGYSIMRILPKEALIESGEINFEGKNLLSLPENRMQEIRGRQISIIFQEPFTSLNPVLRIGNQLEEVFLIHGNISKGQARTKALHLLEKVHMDNPERIFYDYPHRLSGGQRQRVMIAMALALDPKLLIADEPTTALDITIQAEILKLLKKLKQELKLSVLFITHDFSIVNEMADRVLVMKEGKIVEAGTKQEILSAPKNEYTRKLIEAVPKISRASSIEHRASEAFIETRNLSKSFIVEKGIFRKETGRIQAVKDVSIKIERGKTLGLAGESGCGKSTLARLLLGLEDADSGEILVSGIRKRHKKIMKMLQIVFQDPYSSLDPRMKMRDIILEGARLSGISKKEEEILLKDILEKAQLNFQDRFKYPHQFSGGQRQRIAIARALAIKPEFIVLDEPISSLDVIIQKDILNMLMNLKRDMRLTYLFISHDLRVVELIADNVCIMKDGEIVESAAKDQIFSNPKHPYTKKLLESAISVA